MLSSSTHRGAIRALCFISLCVAVLAAVSLRASRQQARTAEPREVFGSSSPTLSPSDNGVITPDAGNTISRNFLVTVNPFANTAPSFTKGPNQIVLEDSGAQTVANWATNISPGPPSESGQALTFNVTGNTNPAMFSAGPAISSTGTLTYTPAANVSGTASITVTLKDDGGTANGGVDTSAPQTFAITINAVNDVPSFTKGPDRTIGANGGPQTIPNWATNISAGAPDESGQTLTFSVISNTNTALFSAPPGLGSNGTLAFTLGGAVGTATITIVLKDNGGTANGGADTSAPQSFTITVPPCGNSAVVTNTNDSGPGSLRDALANVCAGGTITFNSSLSGQAITLTSNALISYQSMIIDGLGANLLTVRATGGRVFETQPNITVLISGLKMSDGVAGVDGGGGIYNRGTLTLTNCTVSGNSANFGGFGGGIYNTSSGTLTLTNSTVSGNSVIGQGHFGDRGDGGGIVNSGTITLTNSTVSGNSSVGGTGSIINGGTMTLTNSTVSGNGGGIFNSGSANLRNTILDGISGTVNPASSFNLIGSGSAGGLTNGVNHNQVGVSNLLLGALANNGGPTQTMALLPGSPAINAGDNCVVLASGSGGCLAPPLTTDQRGLSRQVNGTVDIGAFESRGFTIAATSGAPQSATINTNFAAPLVATVSSSVGEPVAGGFVTFTAPATGPSTSFTGGVTTFNATINASGQANALPKASVTAGGPYNVTANGNGIANSVTFALTNTKGPSTTTVTSAANPSEVGQSVTFTATVSSGGAGVPTGTVQFKIDGANSGAPVALNSSGFATLTTSSLTLGTHTVAADYSGDTNLIGSSGALSGGQVVLKPGTSTTTAVTSSRNPSDPGQSVTFIASVSSASGTPTGTVQFKIDDSNSGAPVALNNGIATLTASSLTVGTHSVVADYGGAANFGTSTGTLSGGQAVGSQQGGTLNFSSSNYNVGERDGFVTITVNRTGTISGPATVDYRTDDTIVVGAPKVCSTSNGWASERCDYTKAAGTLAFAAGESSKTFKVLITQDNYVEGPEMFSLVFSSPTGGAVFGVPATATVTIADSAPQAPSNPIDDAQNFVRQHYHDFLNREPDASGLAFWTNQITSCGSDQACIEMRRINVSAAFYLSVEFQETGYLVEKLYKASYGDAIGGSAFGGSHQLSVPVVRFNEFLPDTQELGQGVVVGQPGWQQVLETNKVAFMIRFVQRARFTTPYPTNMTPAEFVDKLFLNAGVTPTPAERQAAIGEFGVSSNTVDVAARGRALRRVAENATLSANEFNRAFVLMAYFGYLRRNPNEAPDSDYTGYDFWLTKLNQFNGNFVNAEMVKAFIVSGEYRQRFAP